MTALVALVTAGGALALACLAKYQLRPAATVSLQKRIKPSKLRYKTMLAEVSEKVDAAFLSGDYANPYQEDDKRHARFARNLLHKRITAAVFDM